ncbi:hypothetical protein [Microbacterium sp. 2MCAF23]|uniref:hypothetical protein n=1 Tax=Microbacterium sp. 2MCAF23 TaxID=3232985 RepID=UPI003F9D87CB
MSGLREELLGGVRVPQYLMVLPVGWRQHDLSRETEEALLAGTGRGVADDAALAADHERRIRATFADLRAQKAFCYAVADEDSPAWTRGAASLIGTKVGADPLSAPDRILDDAIRRLGARPLDPHRLIARWAQRVPVEQTGGKIVMTTVSYLIAIPGTRRTQAVRWTAAVAHSGALAPEDPALVAWERLMDAHLETFTWIEE